MKKVLWLGLILSLLFVSHSFAAPTFSATEKGNVITGSLSGGSLTSSYRLIIQTVPFSTATTTNNLSPSTDPTSKITDNTGAITWTLNENYNTTYYIKAVEDLKLGAPKSITTYWSSDPVTIKTDQVTLYFNHLTTETDGGDVLVKGFIDPSKNPNFKNLTVYLTYSKSKDLSNPIVTGIQSRIMPSADSASPYGISTGSYNGEDISDTAPAGSYFWLLTDLVPNTPYYMQQKIVQDSNNTVYDRIEQFTPENGIAVPSGSNAGSSVANNSYTLLSDPSKQTVLPDPAVCAQEQAAATAAGKTPPPCSINDYLDIVMKILIGLCGVMLVLRLMLVGFEYMTTDLPFKKAGAKSKFMTSLSGLLVALSSWVILNTVNPKLVNETINVQQLAIGIDGDTNTPTTFVSNGQMPTGVICPGSGRSSAVGRIAPSWKGKVTYSQTNKSAAAGPGGYAVLDCSSFVNTVLKCAGYTPGKDFLNEGTAGIFASAEVIDMPSGFKVSGDGKDVFINGKKLNPGDVIGWPPSKGVRGNGHAIIYIGNGTFYDSHGGTSGRQPGNAIGVYSASDILQRFGGNSGNTITNVERMPS